MSDWYQVNATGLRLSVYVQPGAKKSELAGLHDNALKIRIKAPPVEGQANECLRGFLAQLFAVPVRAVTIKSGESGRRKIIEISGSTIAPDTLLASGSAE